MCVLTLLNPSSVVISSIVESTQVALQMNLGDSVNVNETLAEWNRTFSHQVDYLWHSRPRTTHRTSLEKAYGREEGMQYVAEKLGTIEEGLEKMRAKYQTHLEFSRPVIVFKTIPAMTTEQQEQEEIQERIREARVALDEMLANNSGGRVVEMQDMGSVAPSSTFRSRSRPRSRTLS